MKKTIAILLAFSASAFALPIIEDNTDEVQLPPVWEAASGKDSMRALKVAEIDALRKMAEKIYGFNIEGSGTVYDFMLEDSKLNNRVSAIVKGAVRVGEPVYSKDGAIYVEYALTMKKVLEEIKTSLEKKGDKTYEVIEKQIVVEKRLIKSMGSGALPNSLGLKKVRAKRAAELDAYGNMAARIMGVKIDAKTTVRDLALESDEVQASICAYLKGIKLNKVKYSKKGCEVEMQLKIREVVETIETIGKRYKKGWSTSKETLVKVNKETIDRIFKVSGKGAFRDDKGTQVKKSDLYSSEKTILRRLISTEVIAE